MSTWANDPMTPGSRWFIWGRHWTVKKREERRTPVGHVAPMVLLVPDGRKKSVPADWVEERLVTRYARPSGA